MEKKKVISRGMTRVRLMIGIVLVGLLVWFGWVGVKGDNRDKDQASLAEEASNKGVVQLSVVSRGESKDFELQVTDESTVWEVLQNVSRENNINVEVKDYGGEMGVLVNGIDGVEADISANMFWHLYINDELSSVGASFAKVKADDDISWRYEETKDNY